MTSAMCNLRAEALFASALQPSQDPAGKEVRAAVEEACTRHGAAGCAAVVAQEYGEHPDLACARMRWCRAAVREAYAVVPV